MKTYRGTRLADGTVEVTVDGAELNPRSDLVNHSPDGFEWGYFGSGPAQLALALCTDALSNDKRALAVYMAFKSHVVAYLPHNDWSMTDRTILSRLEVYF